MDRIPGDDGTDSKQIEVPWLGHRDQAGAKHAIGANFRARDEQRRDVEEAAERQHAAVIAVRGREPVGQRDVRRHHLVEFIADVNQNRAVGERSG